MIEELEKQTGTRFPPSDQLDTPETNQFLRDLCTKVSPRLGAEVLSPATIRSGDEVQDIR